MRDAGRTKYFQGLTKRERNSDGAQVKLTSTPELRRKDVLKKSNFTCSASVRACTTSLYNILFTQVSLLSSHLEYLPILDFILEGEGLLL